MQKKILILLLPIRNLGEVLTLSALLKEKTVKIINFITVECNFQLH
jgi:hypothetical protein